MCLYWPARKAGFVTDFTGWLDQVQNHSFREYINRTNFQAQSWYQFTQFNTWVFYRIFGLHEVAWHVLFVSLHALNVSLLYTLVRRLLADAAVKAAGTIAASGALLFCVSPYISEVIVWEPAFHFLQGLLLVLLILFCVQRYVATGQKWLAGAAVGIYLLSLFSLELFYITPWLVLSLGVFNRFLPGREAMLKRVSMYFFLPMLLLFVLRFAGYRLAYGDWVSRIGSGSVVAMQWQWFGKPAKYLFHMLLLGRFWTFQQRHNIYSACDSWQGLVIFYGFVLLVFIAVTAWFRRMGGRGRVASLLSVWLLLALLLLVPLWFADDLLVIYDRYTYFAGGFFYMLLAVLVSMVSFRIVRVMLSGAFAILNFRYAVQVSRYWCKSYRIVSSLLHTQPDERSKIMLLLNLPQCMHGVPMIGAEKNSEYKLMHDLLVPGKLLTNTVYDVMAYNMLTPADGAHVTVINDSLVKVTLNQWGTWWWLETRGGYSYETTDYKLDLKDPGHWYELTLRRPAANYMLLYNVGDQWHIVDMNKKGIDQN